MAKKKKEKKDTLTKKQERFCNLYVSEEFFGNGTEAYTKAYDVDVSNGTGSARSAASLLLTNIDICHRINELLDEAGLNDTFVDKQLLFMITQNADFGNKMAAVREYNKLKQRITDKIDHSSSDGTMSPKGWDDWYDRDRGKSDS